MEFIAKTRKLGGSLVATIPKQAANSAGIRENQLIRLELHKARKDFFGAFKGIGHFTKADELDVE